MSFWSKAELVPENVSSILARKGLSATPITMKGGPVLMGGVGIDALDSEGVTFTEFKMVVI